VGIGIREVFTAAELLESNVDARGGKRPQKSLDARLGSNSNFRKFKLTYANQAEAFGAQRSVNRRHRDINLSSIILARLSWRAMYSNAAANGAPSMRFSKRPHSSAFQRLQICIEFPQPQYIAQAEQ